MGVNLLTTNSIPTTRSLKALKADDQDLGYAIELESLCGLYMLLALITVPLVVFVKGL